MISGSVVGREQKQCVGIHSLELPPILHSWMCIVFLLWRNSWCRSLVRSGSACFSRSFDRIHLGDAVWSCSWELLCIGLGELFSFVVTACSLRACVRLSALCSVQSCPAGSKNC